MRVWNAESQSYDDIDATLTGAPSTPEECDTWYTGLIRTMKESPFLGPEMVDQLVTSTKHTEDPDTGAFTFPDAGSFSNRWTELAVSTTP